VNIQDLRKSPLFQGLSDDELQQLMDKAEPVSLKAGEPLMKQGEEGDSAFVVVRGGFEIQKQSGQTLIKIDERNEVDVLGEMAL
jgi:CRP-like cAMP-binding protein